MYVGGLQFRQTAIHHWQFEAAFEWHCAMTGDWQVATHAKFLCCLPSLVLSQILKPIASMATFRRDTRVCGLKKGKVVVVVVGGGGGGGGRRGNHNLRVSTTSPVDHLRNASTLSSDFERTFRISRVRPSTLSTLSTCPHAAHADDTSHAPRSLHGTCALAIVI